MKPIRNNILIGYFSVQRREVISVIRDLINQRTEKAQAEMEMRNNEIENLRRAKRRLFKKANTKTKDILMKQEELESRE